MAVETVTSWWLLLPTAHYVLLDAEKISQRKDLHSLYMYATIFQQASPILHKSRVVLLHHTMSRHSSPHMLLVVGAYLPL